MTGELRNTSFEEGGDDDQEFYLEPEARLNFEGEAELRRGGGRRPGYGPASQVNGYGAGCRSDGGRMFPDERLPGGGGFDNSFEPDSDGIFGPADDGGCEGREKPKTLKELGAGELKDKIREKIARIDKLLKILGQDETKIKEIRGSLGGHIKTAENLLKRASRFSSLSEECEELKREIERIKRTFSKIRGV